MRKESKIEILIAVGVSTLALIAWIVIYLPLAWAAQVWPF